jgi:hypothetical protein
MTVQNFVQWKSNTDFQSRNVYLLYNNYYSKSISEQMFKGKNYLSFVMLKVNHESTMTFF